MSLILTNIFRFVVLILFQGLILNQVTLLGGQMLPMLYVLAILMLPIETPPWLVLIISFVAGACIDVFSNTLGMHISASLLLGFLRGRILPLLAPREGYEMGVQPRIDSLGLTWFVSYAGILILAHHFWLFFLEIFRFTQFFSTLLRVLLSSAFTLVLAIMVQYLFYHKRRL